MSASATREQPPEDREISHLANARLRRPAALMQFSLGTLLMVMTLVAVGAGLMVAIPPLGGWFLVVGSLALVRTIVECRRFLKDGRELLLGDKLSSFLGSLGYSFLAAVSAMIVFGFFSIFAMGLAGLAQWVGEALGGPVAAAIATSAVALMLMLGVIIAAGMAFFSVYWKTILPRTTLDPPTAPRAGPDNTAP